MILGKLIFKLPLSTRGMIYYQLIAVAVRTLGLPEDNSKPPRLKETSTESILKYEWSGLSPLPLRFFCPNANNFVVDRENNERLSADGSIYSHRFST